MPGEPRDRQEVAFASCRRPLRSLSRARETTRLSVLRAHERRHDAGRHRRPHGQRAPARRGRAASAWLANRGMAAPTPTHGLRATYWCRYRRSGSTARSQSDGPSLVCRPSVPHPRCGAGPTTSIKRLRFPFCLARRLMRPLVMRTRSQNSRSSSVAHTKKSPTRRPGFPASRQSERSTIRRVLVRPRDLNVSKILPGDGTAVDNGPEALLRRVSTRGMPGRSIDASSGAPMRTFTDVFKARPICTYRLAGLSMRSWLARGRTRSSTIGILVTEDSLITVVLPTREGTE